MNDDRLPLIQVLRAAAATCVVAVHAIATSVNYAVGSPHAATLAPFLAFGVDLFFVISGAVIYITTTRSNLSASEFAERRLRRIVPLYWLLTTLFFVVTLAVPSLKAAATMGWAKFIASLFFVSFSNWSTPVIYPGWSLEYEMIFYALTVFALALAPRRPWPIVVAVICSATLVRPWAFANPKSALDFLTNPVALSFVGGILVAQLACAGKPSKLALIFYAIAIGACAIAEPTHRAVVAGLPSALVVYLAIGAKIKVRNSWLTTLGDASYATYLSHVFVIAAVGKVSRSVFPALSVDALAAIMTVTSLAAGLAIYAWIERPVLAWTKRRMDRSSAKATASVARQASLP